MLKKITRFITQQKDDGRYPRDVVIDEIHRHVQAVAEGRSFCVDTITLDVSGCNPEWIDVKPFHQTNRLDWFVKEITPHTITLMRTERT